MKKPSSNDTKLAPVPKKAKRDKGGKLIGWRHVLNPAMPALLKVMRVRGISFDSLLTTPAARAKAARGKKYGDEGDAATGMARILKKMAGKKVNA